MLRMIIARRDALLPRQRPTNLNLRQPGSSQPKDAPDDLRGFRIDEPMVLVCRIFHIAKAGMPCQRLSRISLELRSGAHLPRLIFQIPLVHDVQDSGILGAVGVGIVDAVVYGDEPNTHPGEIDFCVKAGFDVIASDAAHILHNHRFHNPVFNIRNQLLPAGTVKISAAVAVVRVVTAAGEALFPCVVLKKDLLIGDGVRFAT